MRLFAYSTVLLAIGALFTLVVFRRVRTWSRLRHIPGPRLAGWSRLWLVRQQISGRYMLKFREVSQRYGPVARIGPTYVLISSPTEIRRIWSIRSGYYRAPWYEGFRFDPNRDSLVTTIQPAEHSRIRGLVIPGYSGKRLMPNQEQVMDEHIQKFLSLIERRYVSSRTKFRPWEMARGMQYLTWDVASAVEFGEPFGFLDADADMYDAIAALETMVLPCGIMALLPELLALVKSPLIKPLLPKPTDSHGVGRLLGVIAERIEARYSQKVHRDDVLQVFMRSGLSRDDVESEALLHLFAGSDTTAMAARTTVFYIATCPAAYKRLQAEIDGVAATVTRPVISDGEAKGLRFLQACIKESLRMWPPAAAIAAKISDVDDVISGVKVPAGTSVAVSWLEMMRDKNVFGEDAEIWSPARWLDSDPETLKEMEATQGMAFANGSRWECLGKRLASMELGKVLFELFLRYDFAMTNPVEPFQWNHQGLTMHRNMRVTVTKRETDRDSM